MTFAGSSVVTGCRGEREDVKLDRRPVRESPVVATNAVMISSGDHAERRPRSHGTTAWAIVTTHGLGDAAPLEVVGDDARRGGGDDRQRGDTERHFARARRGEHERRPRRRSDRQDRQIVN